MTVQDRLIRWFAKNARDLPWREPGTTPWQVLVSEIMLQQTQAQRVAVAYAEWIQRWPTPESLANATPAQVLRQWGNLGYPSRALRLRACAQTLCEQFQGVVPDDYATLKSLPGIGDYTASAIIAFAFKKRSIVLDTNVRRVLCRIWDGQAMPNPSISATERSVADSLTPKTDSKAAKWSIAVMEFGALVCTARQPSCLVCPVSDACKWYELGQPAGTTSNKKQRFAGTDRQVRGKIMAVLRTVEGSVSHHEIAAIWPDDTQRKRALDALLADDLIEVTRSGRYRLPTR